MTRYLLRVSMFAALMASVSNAETHYFDVPFNFAIGNKTVPAGKYVVDQALVPGITRIDSADGGNSFLLTSIPVNLMDRRAKSKLVFQCYAGRYFLSEIWSSGTGRKLPRSVEERELAAQHSIPRSQTTIALR